MPLDTAPHRPAPSDLPTADGAATRPRILLAAALRVAAQYRRARDLPHLLAGRGAGLAGSPAERLELLESWAEEARATRAPGYRPSRQVALLGALLAEGGRPRAAAPAPSTQTPRPHRGRGG